MTNEELAANACGCGACTENGTDIPCRKFSIVAALEAAWIQRRVEATAWLEWRWEDLAQRRSEFDHRDPLRARCIRMTNFLGSLRALYEAELISTEAMNTWANQMATIMEIE